MEKSENGEGNPRDLFGIGCVFWMVAWLFLHSLLTTCHRAMFLQRFSTGPDLTPKITAGKPQPTSLLSNEFPQLKGQVTQDRPSPGKPGCSPSCHASHSPCLSCIPAVREVPPLLGCWVVPVWQENELRQVSVRPM